MFVVFVIVWVVWFFYRVVWMNFCYGVVIMDIFIFLGIVVVLLWFFYVFFFGIVGVLGMIYLFEFMVVLSDGVVNIYFEVGVGVMIFIFVGCYFEKCLKW